MRLVRNAFTWGAASLALALTAGFVLVGCNKPDSASDKAVASKHVLILTEASFQAEVLEASQPVLVDFWATWCGPCKVIAPIVADLATEFEGRVKVGKVDVDAQSALAQKYNISAIPTLVLFKDGKPVDQMVGVQSKEALRAKLNGVLAASSTASGQ